MTFFLTKALAELGADLNAVGGPDEDTPLIVAVYYGYETVVEVLLDEEQLLDMDEVVHGVHDDHASSCWLCEILTPLEDSPSSGRTSP